MHVGDVVHIHDDGPRLKRKLVVVEQLLPGNDGRVCTAVVCSSQGLLTRQIARLYRIEYQ
ncbi:hypothetical protein DPMN_029670 [Dreissena polymorpha]|uniref:DUF5641 domain-containing protein n=1 Tax=Dreissena polymorpha TaxID=45954 RepID=A0A9D4LXM5_DREPO|nr:hypothetical protein DPMN_029670 [Dreissena polymorpha]